MGLLDKVKSVFGQDDYEDEYDDYDDDYDYDAPKVPEKTRREEAVDYMPSSSRSSSSRSSSSYSSSYSSRRTTPSVVNVNTNVQMQVSIICPDKYEDAKEVCDHIKARRPVVVNLEQVEYPVAQRIMDFLSGTCYSLEGTIQRISNNIFIIAPENVDVSGDFKEELKSKGTVLPWGGSFKS
mgnify:CR=1 FL=1